MKAKYTLSILLCCAFLAGCKGAGGNSGGAAQEPAADIHESPASIVEAYFDAVFGGDIDALMMCCDPDDPDKDFEATRENTAAFYGSPEYKQWLESTTRPEIMDVEFSDDFEFADVIYEYESAGVCLTDNTTVHCRDGKWYVD